MICECRALLAYIWLLMLAVPGTSASAAGGDATANVHVGVVYYSGPSETLPLREALQRELRARPERPAISYRVTVLGIPFTDDAGTAAVNELKRLRVDIVLLTAPMLIDKVLQTIDSVPIVTAGQATLRWMPFIETAARPGGRVTGFIREGISFAKDVELLQ